MTSTLATLDPATLDLAEVLAKIASALRVPVLVLALIALLVCALEVGRFIGEYYRRARAGRNALRGLIAQVSADPDQATALYQQAPTRIAGDALVQIARARLAQDPAAIEHALADYELASQRRLERTRILVRVGPALGLMGTLIPLAPGLAALGHGQISTLATDLRTAFAATTIGLLVGTVAFALTLTRTRMYSEDLAALERAGIPPVPAATHLQQPALAPARAIPPIRRLVYSAQQPVPSAPSPPPPMPVPPPTAQPGE
jgi:biopolymer transport protein ExbB/TolQ